MNHLLFYLTVPALWLLGTTLCWWICKLRKVHATLIQCLIIGGLPLALGVVPLPLPFVFQVALSYALTVYVTMKYLGVSLVPDGLLIPLVTALGSRVGLFVLEQIA